MKKILAALMTSAFVMTGVAAMAADAPKTTDKKPAMAAKKPAAKKPAMAMAKKPAAKKPTAMKPAPKKT
jgi:hypothetical protein